ncbi:MAG: PLDc N-terminal domain-containing protein [Desulfovibrionaceae bacterium]
MLPLLELSLKEWIIILLPLLPTLWAIYHVWKSVFASQEEKILWLILTSLLPVLGACIYFLFGIWRVKK